MAVTTWEEERTEGCDIDIIFFEQRL